MKSATRMNLFFPSVIVLNAILFQVVADQVFPAHLGGAFGRSSREPKYRIEFHPEDALFHPDEEQESIIMSNKNGQKFQCYLPRAEKSKSGKPSSLQNISSMIMETEKRVKMKTPDELLEVLTGQCFIRQEGWWSYEFCYQKKLRQVHLEDDKVVQEFVLGEYDAEATAAFNLNLSDVSTLKDPRSIDASQRYHAHMYTNGTTCDLTNEPRQTEVRFVCSEARAMITSITELSTCNYALTIQCPMLCKHPLFQEERPVWRTIHCNWLPNESAKVKSEEGKQPDNGIGMIINSEDQSNSEAEK